LNKDCLSEDITPNLMVFLIEYDTIISIQIGAKVAQKGFQKYHIYFTLFAKPKGCFTKIFKKDSF
ncbi:hypothetical protein, partial [Bacteroides nordii]|uniref:hypothetical protein n=1 Tax=Bacteroides nordii TaxID=291645 RepID=UPI001E473042